MSVFTEWRTDIYSRTLPPPPPVRSGFDLGAARTLGWVAQLAYETADPNKIRKVLGNWGWADPRFHSGRFDSVLNLTSARGFVSAAENLLVIAFSGTDPLSLDDWVLDFSVHNTAAGIHEGFARGVAAVWDAIGAALRKAPPASGIYVTGHSLGGALAVVLAERLLREQAVPAERLLGVYTFGMPRAGNSEFAGAYEALRIPTFRLVHGEDIVPHVPPFLFGARHVGRALTCAAGAQFDPSELGAAGADAGSLNWDVMSIFDRMRRKSGRVPAPPLADEDAIDTIAALPSTVRHHLPDCYLRALGALTS